MPIPFEKSFASHEKSKYWSDKNGDIKPNQVYNSSHTKCWFECYNCKHHFNSPLNSIQRGRWCPFCTNPPKQLCEDMTCMLCQEKSFASHENSKYWSKKNGELTPRQVFKSSNNQYMFECSTCHHEFKAKITDVTKYRLCPFCSNKQLCNDENCKICETKSFALHPKSKYWSKQNGDITPRQIFKYSNIKFIFECPSCKHDFKTAICHITSGKFCSFCANKQLCTDNQCQICHEKSFASHPKSQYWCKEKNDDVIPRQVFKSSSKQYWFTCENCAHDFETIISSITGKEPHWCPFCANQKLCTDNNCVSCYEKSFASQEKSKYWSSKNGDIIPRDVFKFSPSKYYFDCIKCGHVFDIQLNSLGIGRFCQYCANRKICDNPDCTLCLNNSFASHPKSQYWCKEKNGDITPRQVFKSCADKFWFTCYSCNHDFDIKLNNISSGNQWCPFCCTPTKQLCDDPQCNFCYEKSFASNPKSKYWCKEQNGDATPRQIAKFCNKKFWFECESNHLFDVTLSHVMSGNWCPKCKNKTELKLYNALISHYPTIIQQFRVDWCKNKNHLPYDFCIPEHKIIIELDGPQHFRQISNWQSPEQVFEIDQYKEQCANENDYSVIRIIQEDVFYDKYDWLTDLIHAIQELIQATDISNIYLCKNNEYDRNNPVVGT
jgi:very-short-patch-repair endonuclease